MLNCSSAWVNIDLIKIIIYFQEKIIAYPILQKYFLWPLILGIIVEAVRIKINLNLRKRI